MSGKSEIYLIDYGHDPNMTIYEYFNWRPSFHHLYKYCKNPVIVEIGVLEGFNADLILKFLNPYMLYLIDPYIEYKNDEYKFNQGQWDEIYKRVKEKYKGVSNVTLLRTPSSRINTKKEFDFVYIDGDHNVQTVYSDLRAWYPRVKKGGTIAGHDCNNGGVLSALCTFTKEIKPEQGDFELFQQNEWWIHKK